MQNDLKSKFHMVCSILSDTSLRAKPPPGLQPMAGGDAEAGGAGLGARGLGAGQALSVGSRLAALCALGAGEACRPPFIRIPRAEVAI